MMMLGTTSLDRNWPTVEDQIYFLLHGCLGISNSLFWLFEYERERERYPLYNDTKIILLCQT